MKSARNGGAAAAGGVCLAALAMVVAGTAPAGATTLEEAVEMAVSTHPRVGAAAENREAISHELRQSRSFYLPQLDVSASIGRARINDQTTRRNQDLGLSGDDDITNTREQYSVTLQQRLFDGFETDGRVARDKARLAAAAHRVYERSEFLGLDVVDTFLEVRRQRRLLQLAEDNVAIHREILEAIRDRLERGVGSRADVVQTEARLARSQAEVSRRRNSLRDAEARYAQLVGQFPEDLEQPTFPEAAMPTGVEPALAAVLDDNPTIRALEADVRAADAEIELAESDFYPNVNLVGQSLYNDGIDGTDTYEYEHRILVELNWNLFSGGEDVAARKEAISRRAEARNERYRAVIEAREEVRRSFNALEAARQRVEELRRAVDFNVQTRDAYREQFQVAQRTLLDVLDAENELFVTRSELVSARTVEEFSKYRVLALTGVLLKTLEVRAAEESSTQPSSFGDDILGLDYRQAAVD